jgi:Carboxypeptidase regulatory-like domain
MPAVLAAIVLTLASQQPQRDAAPAAAARGSATIRGRVVAPGSRTPVASALVSIGGPPGFRVPYRTVNSDGSGRFEFTDLVAGTYTLTGAPAPYQLQFLPGPRVEVPLADGQLLEGVEVPLARAAAIAGRLVDEFGQPIGGVTVYAMPVGSRPGTGSGRSQTSDEFGRFRLFNLTSGDYYVVARPLVFYDLNVPHTLGLLETYFPGTLSKSEAGRVTVRVGEETDAGDLRVLRGRLSRVRGMVVDSQGRPAPSNRTMVSVSCGSSGMSRGPDAQGRFEFQPQTQGSCRLTATMRADDGRFVEEYVAQPLTLANADVDVLLTMRPAVNLTGRVVIEDAAPPRPGTLSVRVQNSGTDLWIEPAPITKDLTFTLSRLVGEQLLRIEGDTAGQLTVKAVMRGDEDITDVPTEFRPEDAVRIVLGTRTSGVQGTVTTDNGKPATNRGVLVFSEDRRTWVKWSTRVLTELRTDRAGHYSCRVPPGRYYVVAIPPERATPPYEVDPEVLDSLVRDATTVVVGPDEIRVVDLRLTNAGGY